MKKIILFLAFLLVPCVASASIDQNLYYGMNNSKVAELQQFLISKGLLTSKATGRFLLMTFNAVKQYQVSKNIRNTGYVGPQTRQAINADLTGGASQTTSTSTSILNPLSPLTGSLDLSLNTNYSAQVVTAPQFKFKLADFNLKNNTNEPINIKNIRVDLATGSDLYITSAYMTNLYVFYGANKAATLETVAHSNYWSVNYQLPVGQTINLAVYGDVNSLTPLNSNIQASVLVSGTTVNSSASISTNSGSPLVGQGATFGTASFSIERDGSAPGERIIMANQKVVAGKYKVTTIGAPYTLNELKFVIPNARFFSAILNISLTDGETGNILASKPISANYEGNNPIMDFIINLPIPANSSKSLVIYYDLGTTIYSNTANVSASPVLVYIRGLNSSGLIIDGSATEYPNISAQYGGITLPSTGIASNKMYIVKSVPTISTNDLSTTAGNNSDVDIYSFSVKADQNGDISFKQVVFAININNGNNLYPYLNNFKIFRDGVNLTPSALIGTTINNNYVDITSDRGIGYDTKNIVLSFYNEETVQAGKTKTYVLRARTNNFTVNTTGAASISTNIPADSTISSNGSYLRMVFNNIYGLVKLANDIDVVSYNFLWSDRAALAYFPHSDSNGGSTPDWYNGFGISTLPSAAKNVTAK